MHADAVVNAPLAYKPDIESVVCSGTMVEICRELGHHASDRLDFVAESACIPSTGGQLRISMREAEFKNPANPPPKK